MDEAEIKRIIEEALKKGYEAVNKISFEGMQYRRDIGKKALNKGKPWKNYWGSSKDLLADIKLLGKHNFKKEILKRK